MVKFSELLEQIKAKVCIINGVLASRDDKDELIARLILGLDYIKDIKGNFILLIIETI